MPDRMPDWMPEDMSDRVPEDMPDRIPEDLPDRMPDHMPEDMPDRMPNRMSEDMSDRLPEDVPVRKCINVMVGITRSKVIFWVTLSSMSKHQAFSLPWFVQKNSPGMPWLSVSQSLSQSAMKSCFRGGHELLFRGMEFLPLLLTSDFCAVLVLWPLGESSRSQTEGWMKCHDRDGIYWLVV